MNTYSDKNPPKVGTAKKIFTDLKKRGFTINDLHYNPNLWGLAKENGWGTWATELVFHGKRFGCFTGYAKIQEKELVYLEQAIAPYSICIPSQISDDEILYFAVCTQW